MGAYSANQIAFYVKGAGFTGDAVATMTAIVLAESGGDPASLGDIALENSTWGPSVGLAQIRSLNSQKGTGGQRDEIANRDPATNLKNAYAISANGTRFGAWSTFSNGIYLKHMAAAKTGAGNPSNVGNAAVSSSDSSGGSINPFTALLSPTLWLRITAFIMGGALLVFSLLKLTGSDKALVSGTKNLVKTTAKAALV